MAYCYILDIELMHDRLQEADEVVAKVAKLWERNGAVLEVFSPLTGNVNRIFGMFRFDALSDFDELMKKAGQDEELIQLEHHFHTMMIKPVYNLYSKVY